MKTISGTKARATELQTWMGGAALLAVLAAQPSEALASGMVCESSQPSATCRLTLLPGLTLESTLANTVEIDSASYRLDGTVFVVTSAARIPLQESRLRVTLGDEPEIHGESIVPLDRMPLLSEARFSTIPRAVIGLARGDTVEKLVGQELPLNDARGEDGSARDAGKPYLLFHMDAGIAFSLPMEGAFEKVGDVTFSMPGSLTATAVLDLFDPYFYLAYSQTGGIDMEKLTRKPADGGDERTVVYEIRDENGEDVVMSFTLDTETGVLIEDNRVSDTTIEYRRDESGDYVQQNATGEPMVLAGDQFEGRSRDRNRNDDRDAERKDDGEDPSMPIDAIGFSAHGWIPYVAADTGSMPADVSGFSGQLYLHGAIPLSQAVTVDGDVLTYVGANGFAQGGNGEVSLGIPGLPDFIDLSMRLGNASAAVTLADRAQKVFVSGEMKPDTAFLADYLPIMPSRSTRVEGYVGNDLQNTFLSLEGEMGMGADLLGELIGLEMNQLALSRARMIVDSHGVEVSGLTRTEISPDIRLSSAVEVYAAMSWSDPSDLTLSITGNMDLFGIALEDVTLEIGGKGMFVRGAFVTPVTRVALDGRITAAGPQLSGSGSATLDLGGITAGVHDAYATLDAARNEVSELDRAIASMRTVVGGERAASQSELEAARAELDKARRAVSSLQAKIDAQHRTIKYHNDKLAAKWRWYKRGSWWQKAGRYSAYLAEKSWRTTAIGAVYVTIGGLETARAAADLALQGAAEAVRGMEFTIDLTPIDLDPRIASLFVAKETALFALEAAKLPLEGIPRIDATVSAELSMSLGIDGLSGTVSAEVEGASVLQGTLGFDPLPTACVTLPAFGTACTSLS